VKGLRSALSKEHYDFAAKIVLGKPILDVRVFKQPCHETLPH
jgi:hypothetical protein